MGRKSFSVDLINDFIIDNFRPYAWCNMWEETEPDELGVFSFVMVVSPHLEDAYRLPSSNNLVITHPEFYGCNVINIPMVKEHSLIWRHQKRSKNHISQLKGKYRDCLILLSLRALDNMEISSIKRKHCKRQVFGSLNPAGTAVSSHQKRWAKLLAYERGEPRENWSFIPEEQQWE